MPDLYVFGAKSREGHSLLSGPAPTSGHRQMRDCLTRIGRFLTSLPFLIGLIGVSWIWTFAMLKD